MNTRTLTMLALAGVAILAPAPAAPSGALGLTGTWAWTTYVGEVNGVPLGLPALVSFHADRTLVGSDAVMFGGVPDYPYKISPFHGVWARTSPGRFGGTSLWLLFEPMTGAIAGYGRSRSQLRFAGDADHLEGVMSLDILLCDSPVACPDPTSSSAVWIALPGAESLPVSAARVKRVPRP